MTAKKLGTSDLVNVNKLLVFCSVMLCLVIVLAVFGQSMPAPPNTLGLGFPAQVFPNFADAETPGGIVDGINGVFTLAAPPNPQLSLQLFRNGQLLRAGPGNDYTLVGGTVTFPAGGIPQAGDVLTVSYRF